MRNNVQPNMAGTYTVTATDANTCTAQTSVSLTEPIAVSATLETTAISCFNSLDGKAIVHATGGTPNYSFAWSPNVSADSIAQNLAPSIYTFSITDANGCSIIQNFNLTAPAPITFLTATTDSVSCPKSTDGSLQVEPTGGTPISGSGYEYSIDGGATWQPSNTFLNLKAGDYMVKVRDGAGCTTDTTLTIDKPEELVLSILPQDSSINLGGSLQLVTLTGAYTGTNVEYNWTPADGLSCSDCRNPLASPFMKQRYTLVALYGEGCSDTAKAIGRCPVVLHIGASVSPCQRN